MIIYSLGYYDSRLQSILHDLKYNRLKPLAVPLGHKLAEIMAPSIDSLGIDVILPVPLHDSRQYQRGFNQAVEIGKAIGQILSIPLNEDILYATRKTKHQARLPAHEREANVRGAFAVDDPEGIITGKNILLIDDITTTGATLRENESVLLEASAKKIVTAVIATAL
jgi:ComF family protein